MANLPLQDGYETQLAQAWNGATGLIYVLETPVYTPKTTPTIITVNPGKTNAQLAVINDYDASAKTLTVSAVTPLYKAKGVLSTAQSHGTGSKVIISDNYEFWKDLLNTTDNQTITGDLTFDGDATFNGVMNFSNIGDVNVNGKSNPAPVVADTTARDALYTAPVTGDMVYVTALNAMQVYNTATAQWETLDVGTPAPVATESVQGIMKIHAASADPKAIVSEEAGTSATAVSASNKLVDNADTTGTGLIIRSSVEASTTVKGIIEIATDAEVDTGTSTTLAVTANQDSKFSPSTLTRNDWYTFIAPFGIAGNGSGLSSWTYVNVPTTAQDCAMGMFNAIGTGTSSMLISAKIPGVSYSAPTYTPTSSKDIRIKWRMALEKSSGLPRNAIGMCVTNTDIYAVYTSIANGLIRFVRDGSTLYAHNSNGTTATSTDVSSGVTMTNMNTYEIIFNPGVDAKFYINGTLVATHTTNLPTTGSLLFALGADDDGSTTAMYISPITVSIEL